MIKRITLLLAVLFTMASFSTAVLAQDKEETEAKSAETTPETKPADSGGDPECD
jgi:preprotein translocase subunit SecG